MKRIFDIFIAHRHAIIWTVCYIFVMKFILRFLFNFDMFSYVAWQHLMRAHLHGFGGFVFGILVLAAIPLYVATTTIIARTKKPLFDIPVPAFIRRAFAPPAPPSPEPIAAEQPATTEPAPEQFPDTMPAELRGAFVRVRRGGMRPQISAFDNSNIADIPRPTLEPVMQTTTPTSTDTADDFPLPSNFDFADTATETDMPNFTDISFDAPTPAPETAAQPTTQNSPASDIINQLPGAKIDGEFIIYRDMIIVTHDDSDFWIADDIDWFAGGKQRPSPIAAIKQRAADTGLKPVLYLAETNILDIEERVAAWESDGIRVITDLSDLNN